MRSRTRERTHDGDQEGTNAAPKARRGRGRNARKGRGPSDRGGGQGASGSNRTDAERGGGQNRSTRRSKGKGRKRSSPSNRGSQRPQRDAEIAKFWGDAQELSSPGSDLRMTDDPAAVPRSLGSPPLPGHEAIAEHYFRAIYDRAVTTAGVLAAAGGLIDPDVLTEEIQR